MSVTAAAPDADRPVELDRARTARGELALRRRGDVLELVVDGVFAMDTVDVSTERALATLVLQRLAPPEPDAGWHVVVGGLGLGFTAQRLLADPRVASVHVVELHQVVVDWARAGLVPAAGSALADPRVRVEVADVLDAVPALPPGGVDAVLLDVDNGPSFLIHPGNETVYAAGLLTAALHALRPGGLLGIWAAQRERELAERLTRLTGRPCAEVLLDVHRDGRAVQYAIYLAVR